MIIMMNDFRTILYLKINYTYEIYLVLLFLHPLQGVLFKHSS
jgi:hypothetical protein